MRPLYRAAAVSPQILAPERLVRTQGAPLCQVRPAPGRGWNNQAPGSTVNIWTLLPSCTRGRRNGSPRASRRERGQREIGWPAGSPDGIDTASG